MKNYEEQIEEVKKETIPTASKDSTATEMQKTYKSFKHESKVYKTIYFDPNTSDSATLVSMGIKSYVAKNIIPHVQPPRQRTYFLKSQESMKKYTIKTNDVIEQIALNKI